MRMIRRWCSILLGLAAGVAAWRILKVYGSDGHLEGEYVELPDPPAAPEAEKHGMAAE